MKNTKKLNPDHFLTLKVDHYFKGDACKWTGRTREIAGGTFYEYVIVQGHKAGTTVHSLVKPSR